MTTTSAHEDTLVLGEALAQAVTLMKAKQLDAADELLARILESEPGDPDALHYQGLLRHAQGRADESIALIGRSLTLQPAQSGAWNNLGNLLIEAGRVDDAMRAYENSVSFATGDEAADALSNIATLERGKGQWQAAERVSRRAIELRPAFSEAWYNLSIALMEQGRIHESVIANSRAVVLQPRNMSARGRVIRALELLGEREQALGMYREWLAEAPGNPVVSHLLAACEGHTPARASDGYVETVFDSYAGSFDASLEKLHYRAPELVARAVRDMFGPPAARIAVVDAGCGTGLCAPLLRPWASHLAGCDLSVGMLQRADQRGGYDVLHKAELTHYLHTQPGRFDLVVSADTLCYFGDLHEVLAAAARALRPTGGVVFTVEAMPGGPDDFRLEGSGRYRHAAAHVEACLAAAGFDAVRIEPIVPRREAGQDVQGWLASARLFAP
ncbi:putative TPR repeat methyltransferase [Variovorax boronicumulans]|uniref:tetratricopeptide repeat protein n=1 Tax=Variovorax boronicumulans TaxID=436515 RepID=UPI002789CC34|nr:tetratricopeptide repeat protein [Variovorax boronicumulans]MDQ0074398.1 putative TPR repeat methyltransferase [Variovorax boronicumulans]